MSWRNLISRRLLELRYNLCNTSTSNGIKTHLKTNYSIIKILNPSLPIYIRECDDNDSHILAECLDGEWHRIDVSEKSVGDINHLMDDLINNIAADKIPIVPLDKNIAPTIADSEFVKYKLPY